MLAQEFPDGETTVTQRLFSIGIATVGLIFFALILALTEQVIPDSPPALQCLSVREDMAAWQHD